jgi:hypothetical protein
MRHRIGDLMVQSLATPAALSDRIVPGALVAEIIEVRVDDAL